MTGRLVPPPWLYAFLRLRPRRCICKKVLGFVVTFQFRVLVPGCYPCSVGSCQGCAVAQTIILSVPCTTRLSSSARGVCVGLLQGSTLRTPHSHWPINVDQPVLLLSVLRWSSEGYVLVSPQGIPRCCSLPPPDCITLLLGLTAGLSRGKTQLICWRLDLD